ncbi:hypothetical protein ENUP19_0175G0010 [Entamoeba nuttalli]|uniref:cyclin-dependent kinase n=1 Tax=Entamoeba nuttalli TaxID=412467 RepID=A0ABQ0DN03_9EUKA
MEEEPIISDIYYEIQNRRFKKDGIKLGGGSYGEVTLRTDGVTNKKVAVKQFNLGDQSLMGRDFDGYPLEILREIKVLRELDHSNIVKVVDFYFHRNLLYMVMEYHPSDLEKEIRNGRLKTDPMRVCRYLKMILEGVRYLHMNFLLHRDLKPANILISEDDVLKITDFGSVRPFGSECDQFTKGVITPSYRPPEIWFGAIIYGPAVDVWSIGCIFAEMARGEILFAGNDSQILESIYVILGTPNSGPSSEWPGVEKLQGYIKPLQEISINSLSRYVPNLDNEGNLLIHKMLRYNPNKRISCERALKHPYFQQLTMDQSN